MAHGLPKPDAGLWGVDSLCSPMHMYKVLLSSAHQGTTDSLLTRWGAGPPCWHMAELSSGHEWLWLPHDLGTVWSWIHHELICPSLDPSGGPIPPS